MLRNRNVQERQSKDVEVSKNRSNLRLFGIMAHILHTYGTHEPMEDIVDMISAGTCKYSNPQQVNET